jgi:hypothetical protein
MKKSKKSDSVEPRDTLIANPIYDEVFKYMMEDKKAANNFISTILNEDVVKLTPAPQEYVKKLDKIPEKSWSVQRLDYIAHIRTNDGLKETIK